MPCPIDGPICLAWRRLECDTIPFRHYCDPAAGNVSSINQLADTDSFVIGSDNWTAAAAIGLAFS